MLGCVYRLLEIRNGYLIREQKRRYDRVHDCILANCPYFDRRKRVKKELFDHVSLFLQKSVYSNV